MDIYEATLTDTYYAPCKFVYGKKNPYTCDSRAISMRKLGRLIPSSLLMFSILYSVFCEYDGIYFFSIV